METTKEDIRKGRKLYYEARQKEVLRMVRRLDELYKIRWRGRPADNRIKLDKPIRHGWERFPTVRADFARSDEGPRLQRLINMIGIREYSMHKDFKIPFRYLQYHRAPMSLSGHVVNFTGKITGIIGVSKRKKNEILIDTPLSFKDLSEEQFNKLPPELKKYFVYQVHVMRWNGATYKTYFMPVDHRFTFEVVPHYITHAPVIYTEVEAEITVLSRKLFDDGLARQWSDKSHRYKDLRYTGKKQELAKKEMRKEIFRALSGEDL